MAEQLRMILFNPGSGICLYLRLPGSRRLLVECSREPSSAALRFLRQKGEISPLHPLERHLRPALQPPQPEEWLGLISLLRGLVWRPGGSWLFWQPTSLQGPGFSLQAKVVPRGQMTAPPEAGFDPKPLLVLGLSVNQIMEIGGCPQTWLANAGLALKLPRLMPPPQDLLIDSSLPAQAWEIILADQSVISLFRGAILYSSSPPALTGEPDLGQGFLNAALPWFILGGLVNKPYHWWPQPGEQHHLHTPPIENLWVDVDHQGIMHVEGQFKEQNLLAWQSITRGLDDSALPAPAPLQRMLQ